MSPRLGELEHEPDGGPELEQKEKEKADKEESLNANVTYEVIRREGEGELRRTPSALAWSGLAAGLSMGFSFIAEGLLHAYLPEAPWRPLVSKLGYPVGFLIVSLGSQQLFTENTLLPVVPVLSRRSGHLLRVAARLWLIVFLTNIVGTIAFGWLVARTSLFDAHVHEAFAVLSRRAVEADFATTALRAVFAGWLIALMVWMLPAAQTAHVWVIIIMTYLIGIGHFSHIVAGSTVVQYGVASGIHTWGEYLGRFVVPTLLGNVVGGVTLVAALNHAQVSAGGRKRHA